MRSELSTLRIGWIGTGVMGLSLCKHLLANQYLLNIYSRSKHKAEILIEQGARWYENPKALATESDIIFTMVGFPYDVAQVYLEDNGIFAGINSGTVLVDMTTNSPSLAKQLAQKADEQECHFLDAPVTGGDVGARNATLSIMVGGEEPILHRLEPLLRLFGNNIRYHGLAGAGQHAKMCNQIVIAGTMIGVCESLLYAERAGLDLENVINSIKYGAAGCWSLENLAPRILKQDFAPGFYVEHFIKDMKIALDEAEKMNLALPGLALVHQLYLATKAQGYGRNGTQALILALREISQAPNIHN